MAFADRIAEGHQGYWERVMVEALLEDRQDETVADAQPRTRGARRARAERHEHEDRHVA